MDPVSAFTYEVFRDRSGEWFALQDGSQRLELVGAVDRAPAAGDAAPHGARRPFSLLFRGPADTPLAQGIQRMSHDELGEFDLFLVPVAEEEDGIRYEAAFG